MNALCACDIKSSKRIPDKADINDDDDENSDENNAYSSLIPISAGDISFQFTRKVYENYSLEKIGEGGFCISRDKTRFAIYHKNISEAHIYKSENPFKPFIVISLEDIKLPLDSEYFLCKSISERQFYLKIGNCEIDYDDDASDNDCLFISRDGELININLGQLKERIGMLKYDDIVLYPYFKEKKLWIVVNDFSSEDDASRVTESTLREIWLWNKDTETAVKYYDSKINLEEIISPFVSGERIFFANENRFMFFNQRKENDPHPIGEPDEPKFYKHLSYITPDNTNTNIIFKGFIKESSSYGILIADNTYSPILLQVWRGDSYNLNSWDANLELTEYPISSEKGFCLKGDYQFSTYLYSRFYFLFEYGNEKSLSYILDTKNKSFIDIKNDSPINRQGEGEPLGDDFVGWGKWKDAENGKLYIFNFSDGDISQLIDVEELIGEKVKACYFSSAEKFLFIITTSEKIFTTNIMDVFPQPFIINEKWEPNDYNLFKEDFIELHNNQTEELAFYNPLTNETYILEEEIANAGVATKIKLYKLSNNTYLMNDTSNKNKNILYIMNTNSSPE